MKTLLVIAEHPDLADAVRAGLKSDDYRVVDRGTVEEAEPLLNHGLVDACLIDVELSSVQGLWPVEKLRRRAPKCPIIIYTGARQWEWEEEAYLQGARHVLSKPVRPRMLNTVLERIWENALPSRSLSPAPSRPAPEPPPALLPSASPAATQTLKTLRDFSGILSHSLDAEAMLRQFLVLMREILHINRASIFLRPRAGSFAGRTAEAEDRQLRVACSIGISSGLLEHFELSLDSGIGGMLGQLGRILRRSAEEIRANPEAQKEFEVLGAQVAVPILDRETLLGVAIFDGRITGEPLVNSELELVFHLLEQLALAVKNIWLHDQLAGNNEMLTGVLRELNSACVVVGRDLSIVHANKTARRSFSKSERRSGELEFSDLPQVLGSKLYQVLKTGAALSTFRFEPAPGQTLSVSIVPFHRQQSGLTDSALLMAEDLTQADQLRTLELEAANLRIVNQVAFTLTNEIGNALTPLSGLQQLLPSKGEDPDFRDELELLMGATVERIGRLSNQMKFLARENLVSNEPFPVVPLLEEAFREACKHQSAHAPKMKCEAGQSGVVFTGDRPALRHALTEILLNALQANPNEPCIGVRMQAENNGKSEVRIEVEDNGKGFSPEALQQAFAPFSGTSVGRPGLGLAVSRKIIETHHGKLEIVPTSPGKPAIVRICLPLGPGAFAIG
jgi:signal transduction histidine kinase/DNA-binding NarL/FixJ family response regulator